MELLIAFGVIQHALEIDDDGGLIALDPGVVPGGKQGHIAGSAGEFASIVHPDIYLINSSSGRRIDTSVKRCI
jgi:hypothetical protein